MAVTLTVRIHSPVLCRCAGLSVEVLDRIDRNWTSGDLDEELLRGRKSLWSLLEDTEFVECMATTAPEALCSYTRRHWDPTQFSRDSYHRGLERNLYRFATRFCTRNDTAGTAGSTFWGSFDERQIEDVVLVPGKQRHATRVVNPSPQQVYDLMAVACRGPFREHALLMLAPRFRVADLHVLDVQARTFSVVNEEQHALLRECARTPQLYTVVLSRYSEEMVDTLLERGILEALPVESLVHKAVGPLDDLWRWMREYARTPEQVKLLTTVEELRLIREQLRASGGASYAQLIVKADELASEWTAPSIDTAQTAASAVRWFFAVGPCEVLPLRLSRRYRVGSATELLDQRTGARIPIPEEVLVLLQRSLHDRTSLGPLLAGSNRTGRRDLWRLFEKGVLALGDFDPADASADHLTEQAPSHLALICKAWPESTKLAELLTLVIRRVVSAGQQAWTRVEVKKAAAALGVSPSTRRTDRNFFISDSSRDVADFSLGGSLRETLIRDGSQFLKLAAYFSFCREKQTLKVLARAIPRDASIPLAAALAAVRAADPIANKSGSRSRNNAPLLNDDERLFASSIQFTRSNETGAIHIAGITYPDLFEEWLATKRFIVTMDLMMIRREDGAIRALVNEAHGSGSGMPETTLFANVQKLEDFTRYSTEVHAESVFSADTLVLPTELSKQTDAILMQLDGVTIADDIVGRMRPPRSELLCLSALEIVRREAGYAVVDARHNAYRFVSDILCVGDIRPTGISSTACANYLTAVLALEAGSTRNDVRSLPAFFFGDLQITRSRTILNSSKLARLAELSGPALLEAGGAVRRDLNLNQKVFVAVADDKPFYCDFESLLSLEVLGSRLREYSGEVEISNMLPEGPNLWLSFRDGNYTSELRFVMSADGPAYNGKGRMLDLWSSLGKMRTSLGMAEAERIEFDTKLAEPLAISR